MRARRFIALLFMVPAMVAHAQPMDPVPATVSYQGVLLQSNGVTPQTGPATIEFRLYQNKADMTPVWGEKHEGVQLVEGTFSVELGAGAAIDGGTPHEALNTIFIETPPWLGITVHGEPERTERQQFGSTPYAFTADTAMTAVHGVPPGTMAIWGGETVPEGWIRCNGDSYPRGGEYASLFAVIGTTWGEGDDPGNTFNVPNMGGRTPIGAMEAGQGHEQNTPGQVPSTAGLTAHAVGDLLGEETHSLSLAELGSHDHTYLDYIQSGWCDSDNGGTSHVMDNVATTSLDRRTGMTGGIDTNGDGTKDAAAEHNEMQPSMAAMFIIKY